MGEEQDRRDSAYESAAVHVAICNVTGSDTHLRSAQDAVRIGSEGPDRWPRGGNYAESESSKDHYADLIVVRLSGLVARARHLNDERRKRSLKGDASPRGPAGQVKVTRIMSDPPSQRELAADEFARLKADAVAAGVDYAPLRREAAKLVSAHWGEIRLLAAALVEHEEVQGSLAQVIVDLAAGRDVSLQSALIALREQHASMSNEGPGAGFAIKIPSWLDEHLHLSASDEATA